MGKTTRKAAHHFDLPAGSTFQRVSLAEMLRGQAEEPISAFRDVVSADGRRAHRIAAPIGGPPSPVKRNRMERLQPSLRHSTNSTLQSIGEAHSTAHGGGGGEPFFDAEPLPSPLHIEQEPYRMTLTLDGDAPETELPQVAPKKLSKDAPSDPALTPLGKGEARRVSQRLALAGRERCCECSYSQLMCVQCCVDEHEDNPLHWVELWNDHYFKRTSLKSLGLRIQLGHPRGERCSAPLPSAGDFVVIHANGIHEVAVQFCGCHLRRDPDHIQLLRRRWFPATDDKPQCCATFSCLETLHALSLQADIAVRNYYLTLEYLTDGTLKKIPDRYRSLLRMLREYRHLVLLKRRGRGHDPGGVMGTRSGELAIRCPACPRPGVNLPPNWADADAKDQCLYILYMAIDACFRLKRQIVSSHAKDPGLGTGWSYFVEWEPYRQHLLTITDQKEMSTCSGLAALDHANTRFSRGYSVTGVGMCVCARHEMVFPNGVGDLQKGERYGNMDYIFASALRYVDRRLRIFASYDIACQWSQNLRERLQRLPPLIRLDIILKLIRFVIPKMHIKGHTLACQLLFSLYLAAGGAQTDGEGIERIWSLINGIVMSTRSCGPGSRADQLDDHWSFLNWKKVVGLPALLRRRLDAARIERAKQEEAFIALTVQQKEHVPEWQRSVEAYEAPVVDGVAPPPNPYEVKIQGMTEKEVRETFVREEAQESAPKIHAVSPSAFVAFGLDIEDQQRRICVEAELHKAGSSSGNSLADMRRKCNKDQQSWRLLLATYSPASLVRMTAANVSQETLAEEAVAMASSKSKPRSAKAQCREALSRIRIHLHIKSRLMVYKVANARHQGANTRSRALVTRNESKIMLYAEKYQRAWGALVALLGNIPSGFPALLRTDIRCMNDGDVVVEAAHASKQRAQAERRALEQAAAIRSGKRLVTSKGKDKEGSGAKNGEAETQEGTREGESKKTMSWIWQTTGVGGTEAELMDALRIEWCKSFARTRRWGEEERILQEEWRRYPISLRYEAACWTKRLADVQSVVAEKEALWNSAELMEGKAAYAQKQRDMYSMLARRARSWLTTQINNRTRSKGRLLREDLNWREGLIQVVLTHRQDKDKELARHQHKEELYRLKDLIQVKLRLRLQRAKGIRFDGRKAETTLLEFIECLREVFEKGAVTEEAAKKSTTIGFLDTLQLKEQWREIKGYDDNTTWEEWIENVLKDYPEDGGIRRRDEGPLRRFVVSFLHIWRIFFEHWMPISLGK
ncbi:hypothetical protein HMN09_00048200 [Mycena chlorophos]|uniref:CxC2-like cysteine cluster KDZ transposase-associated domain-containing protein n=1 Tax=Mycena chlorophos TaxID=658473 RepID=A0A8H6WL58_MYCCL|nr:hypothetical protein HMN09_00048200 [Mycena chlorophos]